MAYDIWEAQRRSYELADRFYNRNYPPDPPEPEEEEEEEVHVPPQCRHTFEITRPRCLACSGTKRDCPDFEIWKIGRKAHEA